MRNRGYPPLLSDALWTGRLRGRSPEATLLYATRYAGSRSPASPAGAHGFFELTVSLGGTGILETDRGSFTLGPADAVMVPAGMPHRELSRDPGWDVLWIGWRGRSEKRWPAARATLVSGAESLRPWAVGLWTWAQRQWGPIGPELDHALGFLLAGLRRIHESRHTSGPQAWLNRAIDFMHDRLGSEISMDDVAAAAGFSKGHFQRRFRDAVGETPNAYLNRIRLERAAAYLRESPIPVSDIATAVGFPDQRYFSRVWRKAYGLSPTRFRRGGVSL
jgi:AraC-like DNA-binding protein